MRWVWTFLGGMIATFAAMFALRRPRQHRIEPAYDLDEVKDRLRKEEEKKVEEVKRKYEGVIDLPDRDKLEDLLEEWGE